MSNQAQDVIDREDRYQLKTYAKLPLVLERGRGCYVYDIEGNEYLDFYGGHAVISTGHCHPRVVDAIKEQAEQLLFLLKRRLQQTPLRRRRETGKDGWISLRTGILGKLRK